ncbi:MAG: hypothetical protein CME62_13880 [Halobacteriovoraceae bacterium]|nr:hypothetical protein [Halobacteriovoraceae bacterium]|tara:strand:- start:9693 stop:10238 length:546 start_codon:yes stop_codon:yes gene_type:complete
MKYLILLLSLSFTTFAAELNIEPVYGFERTYHALPEPARYRTETFFGARASYGTPTFKGEAEATQSNSSDDINDIEVKYTTQTLMLGLRLVPINGQYFNTFFRIGGRAQKKETEVTESGETTKTTDGPNLDPYAGLGFGLNFGSLFSLNASATLIYNRYADPEDQYDTRYTLGAGIKFGKR